MIDLSKGIWHTNGRDHYFSDGGWNAIVDDTPDEIKAEVTAYLVEHPEALVPEPVPPPPTQEELDRREMAQLLAYLASTDWYVIRGSETGVMIPADVLEKRSDARQRISEIRDSLT